MMSQHLAVMLRVYVVRDWEVGELLSEERMEDLPYSYLPSSAVVMSCLCGSQLLEAASRIAQRKGGD